MKAYIIGLTIFILAIGGDGYAATEGKAQTIQSQVTEIYVATFGRSPDTAGLAYWAAQVEAGGLTVDQVAQSFFDQPETKSKYPQGISNSTFITTIYQNVFNRDPDQAGLDYWLGEFNRGAFGRSQAIMAIINGAKAASGSPTDAAILANKEQVGEYFAASKLGSLYDLPEILMLAKDILTGVNSNSASLVTAMAYIDTMVSKNDTVLINGSIPAHNTITKYEGTATCLSCHSIQGTEMVNSLHAKWKAPTPELTNTKGEELGKALRGINTFCTYAMSSKNACFSCHVRSDGNAPHPAEAKDIDCLMCHSDTYQRKFVSDPSNTQTLTNINGEIKTYVFGKVDNQGNYLIEPDYSNMPAGTSMENLARTVHLPTNKSCLRCHATAGGGDWTKRGDMGLSSVNPTVDEDVHLSQNGAKLACVDCHSALNHKIGGRGIDLRGTEAVAPTCEKCHTSAPHTSANPNYTTLNRHAAGQVSCQVCHIRTFAKGGATEMSRDFTKPVWSTAPNSGQGGFIGEEIKQANVKPEYVWFNGTSYVYNVGDTITAGTDGIYHMAKANGAAFDGKSSIVPIKRHSSIMPLHTNGKIVPPAIMWMFMTGNFDIAVQKGMQEQGMSGSYTLVNTDAEMLITHGVDPKIKAPTCIECHNNLGTTPDGTGIVPFTKLGYHTVPTAVLSCTQCHEKKTLSWAAMHQKHRGEFACNTCHTTKTIIVRED